MSVNAPAIESTETPRAAGGGRVARWFGGLWASLDSVPRGRTVPGTAVVAIVGALMVLITAIIVTRFGGNLAYADAVSHLTIARRIWDSKAAGFEQLGTVWLPIPHLALLPFTLVLPVWASGWSAALLGMFCLAGTTAAVYRLVARMGVGRAGRLTAVLLLVLNPNMLYLHTTALTEPVLILGLAGSFAGLANWATSTRRLSGGELAVFAGVPAAVAVLSRYEGWMLVAVGSVFVAITAWRREKSFKRVRAYVFSFVAVPGIAVLWWVSYNWAIYRNPLEFLNGQYSASALQQDLVDNGLVPTKGNLGLSFATYDASIFQTVGLLAIALGAVGVVVLVFRHGLSTTALLGWITLTPYVFSIISLYLGQSVMHNANTVPVGWWNNRYSMADVLPLAVFAAVGVHALVKDRWAPVVGLTLVGLFGLQTAWWLQDPFHRSSILAEMNQQMQVAAPAVEAAHWLGEHYEGGGILIDEAAGGNAILPMIGVPLAEYYNRSTGELFDDALAQPSAYAQWIIVRLEDPLLADSGPQDLVLQHLQEHPEILTDYRLVKETSSHAIYERTRMP